jgi:putative protease
MLLKTAAGRPQLLAPAGDWPSLKAAVLSGAQAVYFGLTRFSARRRAVNFAPEELPEVMAYLRAHNVLGYVAFNTLVFSDELKEACGHLETIARAGADAMIVQDLGLARLARQVAPSLPLHASTQMTLAHPAGLDLLAQLGVRRVILARELSLAELEKFIAATDMEVEVFVHGALCLSYSGQCLASESLFGRSANRGACDQPCRLPYQLRQNGKDVPLGRRAYLLSPKDLAAWELVGELARLGVAGLKIEGRLKGPNYVAAVVGFYRAALDAACQSRPFVPEPEQRGQLEMSFSRGFTTGHLGGVKHSQLVHGLYPDSRGMRIGRVTAGGEKWLKLRLDRPGVEIHPGDGLVIGQDSSAERGGRVYQARRAGAELEIAFSREVDVSGIAVGDVVYKSDDPALRRRLEQALSRDQVPHRQEVDAELEAQLGQPLRLRLRSRSGDCVEAASDLALGPARGQAFTPEKARLQLDRLGQTPFALGKLDTHIDPAVMVPASLLNQLRRQACRQLQDLQARRAVHAVLPVSIEDIRKDPAAGDAQAEEPAASPRLHLLIRRLEQLPAALEALAGGAASLYLDLPDGQDLAAAAKEARQAGIDFAPAAPRVLKIGQEDALKRLLELEPPAVLVRSLAEIALLRQWAPSLRLIGDASLNLANELALGVLADRLERLTPANDLNARQLLELVGRAGGRRLEIVLHQHLPMFHTQHCLYACYLGKADDCSGACRGGQLELVDRNRQAMPVVADAVCCNTVFAAGPQSAQRHLPEMLSAGLAHFRLELLGQSAKQAADEYRYYQGLLRQAAPASREYPSGSWEYP